MPIYVEKVKDKNGKMIEKKVNGQKQYYIRAYVTDEFGNRKQIKRHNKTWLGRDGYNKAHQEEIRLINKTVVSKDITIKELAESYLKEVKSRVKISTYLKYHDNIYNHILPYFENIFASKITNKNILEWKETISNKKMMNNTRDKETNKIKYRDKLLSLSFKKNLYMTFSALFEHGKKYYNLDNNPVKEVGNFAETKGIKKEMSIMSEEQFNNEFLPLIDNEIYKLAYTFLFYSGVRRGEMLGLTWNNIDFENNTMSIENTYNPKLDKYSDNIQGLKTDNSNRTLQMLPKVRKVLSKLNNVGLEKPFKNITVSTLKRKCDIACKQIVIDNFHIHSFRHSFTSMCIDKGVPIEVISQYLGHKKISMTLDIYSHLLPNAQQKLLDKFL